MGNKYDIRKAVRPKIYIGGKWVEVKEGETVTDFFKRKPEEKDMIETLWEKEEQ